MYQPKDFRRKILKWFASVYTHNQNLTWMKDKKWKLLVEMTYISLKFYICHGATALSTLGHLSIQLTFHCSARRTWRSSRWVIYVRDLCKVCNPLCRLLLTIKHNLNFLVYWRMFHPYWFTVIMCNNSMLIYVVTALEVHTANFHFVDMTVQILTFLVYCVFVELKI